MYAAVPFLEATYLLRFAQFTKITCLLCSVALLSLDLHGEAMPSPIVAGVAS